MNIAIVGASGGIGQGFVRHLVRRHDVHSVAATFHQSKPEYSHAKLVWKSVNVRSESSIQAWAQTLGEIDWLINAVGILHTTSNQPEKSAGQFDPDFFMQNMLINAVPTLLLAKCTQDKFKHGRPAVFATVSARVGSIEDNRLGGWYSYRASKAALNMCVKTLAIEWKRTRPNVAVAVLHPGTTDTALSKPFQKNVPAHKLFSPEQSAGYMLDVLKDLTPEDTGQFWAYNGEQLPW